MKKKIVNAFLMMALIASSMGTFVSCKDYDEDAYVDLRNRISNEVSLRDALQKQVDNLEKALADLKAVAVTKDELAQTLKSYLTKEEAANTYVTLKVYNEYITNNDAKLVLINNAIKDLEAQIADIKKDMATQADLKALEAKIEKANEAASEALGKANEALNLASENAKKIEELEKIIGDPKEYDDSSLKEMISKLQEAIKTLQETVLGWGEEITNINFRIDSIKGALEGYELRITMLEENFDSLAQVVNIQGDMIIELQKQIIQLQEDWNTKIQIILNQAIAVSDEAKQLAQDAMKKATEALLAAEAANAKASNAEQLALNAFYAAQEAVEIAKKTAADMEDAIKRAEAAAAKAEAAAAKAEEKAAAAEAAKAAAEAAQAECEKILEEIKKIGGCDCPADLKERLEKAEADAKEAKEKAELAQKAADAAKETADAAKSLAEAAQKTADTAKETADQAAKDAADAKKTIDELNSKYTDLEKRVKALEEAVIAGCSCGDLKDQVEKAVKEINDKIDGINSDIKDINDKLSGLDDAIKNLKTDFAKQISSILIQGTENPVFGYINVPLDARSTMLMAYFGIADNSFAFPAAGGQWVSDDERFTDEDIAIMTAGGSLSSVPGYITQAGGECFTKDNDGSGKVYMGKVYMTVNPNTVDFTGQTFTLENSQGAASKVTLEPAKKSDHLLTFGYDRTRADGNGFYEADAYLDITDDNLKSLRLSLDLDALKSDIKAISKNKTTSDVATLLASLYRSLDNEIVANAMKASWTDSEGAAHSVYSNYAIGTTTVKPLSFNTLKIDRLKSWPGKKYVYKLIDKIISQIKIHVPNIDLNTDITLTSVEAEGNHVVVTGNVTLGGKKQTVTVEFTTDSEDVTTLEQLKELIITSSNGSTVSVDLADLLNKINNLDTEWEAAIETAKDDMIAGMNKYVDRAFNKANSIFTLYSLLDINLVVYQNGKFKFAGSTVNRATKIDGSAYLLATSNNVEYLAPAYKKYVAISNVYDAATKAPLSQSEAIAKAQAAAGQYFNQVISGDEHLQISGEAGYIYEISYAAVDYHGLKTRQTFYVEF